ncbi:MAG: dephospho-CoA kinase [Eubacteriales bacterium]|nr:dephospho-CoA kinase [Eubacteriales bacterium]
MKHTKILGITGGVGAGKSTILNYLERRYDARIMELDAVAHRLMEPGQPCYEKIVREFGKEILTAHGSIDRRVLGGIVFEDPLRLKALNAIVHPEVRSYVDGEIAGERACGERALVVLEAALLLEEHYEKVCDGIWYIYVRESVRARRLMESRGYSMEKIAGILQNQKSDSEFRRACQFVVDNSSDILENTYEQIDRGLKIYGFL